MVKYLKVAKNHKNFKQKVTAVIPIKNSFDDLKNVPFKKIGKLNLIDIQLKALEKINSINDVIFTTSSQKVINYINKKKKFLKNKNFFIFKRPSKFEKSISSLQEILNFSKNEYFKKGGNSEIFIFLNLHIIRSKVDHVESAINLLKISDFEIVFSVFKEKEPIFKFQKNNFSLLNAGRFNNLDFNAETIFKFNGSVICGNWNILNKGNMFKKKSGFVETSFNEIININSLKKFK